MDLQVAMDFLAPVQLLAYGVEPELRRASADTAPGSSADSRPGSSCESSLPATPGCMDEVLSSWALASSCGAVGRRDARSFDAASTGAGAPAPTQHLPIPSAAVLVKPVAKRARVVSLPPGAAQPLGPDSCSYVTSAPTRPVLPGSVERRSGSCEGPGAHSVGRPAAISAALEPSWAAALAPVEELPLSQALASFLAGPPQLVSQQQALHGSYQAHVPALVWARVALPVSSLGARLAGASAVQQQAASLAGPQQLAAPAAQPAAAVAWLSAGLQWASVVPALEMGPVVGLGSQQPSVSRKRPAPLAVECEPFSAAPAWAASRSRQSSVPTPPARSPCRGLAAPMVAFAESPAEWILQVCARLRLGVGTSGRLACHLWARAEGMVRLVACVRSPLSVRDAAAGGQEAAARVYAAAALWLAAKLEEQRKDVPPASAVALVALDAPVRELLAAAELRMLSWLAWAPYAGYVPDDVHLLTL
jgi:hypothetical protein